MSEVDEKVLGMFNCMVTKEDRMLNILTTVDTLCVAVDFAPTQNQIKTLKKFYSPIPITTLFTVEERRNSNPMDLIAKQVLHYVEVYGLNAPGLFDLEVTDGQVVNMQYVHGVTAKELAGMVQKLLYSNAPISNTSDLIDIVKHYKIKVDLSKVLNNEARILLFDSVNGTFDNGDDAVRYLCYKATGNSMLIKNREMVAAVKEMGKTSIVSPKFFEDHAHVLSQVFNRHKKIILAAKGPGNATVINRIARMSKKNHVPVREHISKRFINEALHGMAGLDALEHVSVRDKFKYLNILAFKKLGLSEDMFVIRNGKIFVEGQRPVFDVERIDHVTNMVIESLRGDLSHLHNESILLDADVDYGLPTSRKQTLGHLPFNTRVSTASKFISAGMYWENAWGATDLDLSTIDVMGNRTGWGAYSGYSNSNPVIFSGDVTSAPNGAMEFMTSSDATYGLFVNIFTGSSECELELVVGNKNKKNSGRWIDDVIIRERTTMNGCGIILGLVDDKEFIVYKGRVSNARTSMGNSNANSIFAQKALADMWTVSKLLDALNINYALDRQDEVEYNHDMDYKSISYDKLEDMFKI